MSTVETAGTLAVRAALLLGVSTTVALAAPAYAQTAAAEDAGDEQIIIVTASKQAKTLQDTPISV